MNGLKCIISGSFLLFIGSQLYHNSNITLVTIINLLGVILVVIGIVMFIGLLFSLIIKNSGKMVSIVPTNYLNATFPVLGETYVFPVVFKKYISLFDLIFSAIIPLTALSGIFPKNGLIDIGIATVIFLIFLGIKLYRNINSSLTCTDDGVIYRRNLFSNSVYILYKDIREMDMNVVAHIFFRLGSYTIYHLRQTVIYTPPSGVNKKLFLEYYKSLDYQVIMDIIKHKNPDVELNNLGQRILQGGVTVDFMKEAKEFLI